MTAARLVAQSSPMGRAAFTSSPKTQQPSGKQIVHSITKISSNVKQFDLTPAFLYTEKYRRIVMDYEGPGPTDYEIAIAEIIEQEDFSRKIIDAICPGLSFNEHIVLRMMESYITSEDPVFRMSLKRLALQMRMPIDDIETIIGRLIAEEYIEPIAPRGYIILPIGLFN